MKSKVSILAGMALAVLLAVPASAATLPAKTNKPVAQPAAMRSAWPPETLSGKITMVDPAQKLVVVQAPDGVPFDMVITGATRINSDGQAIHFNNLTNDMNKTVSVRFVPERRGDVARSIRIGG
jgi:hypothetical protein